jgi:hypothetical protein
MNIMGLAGTSLIADNLNNTLKAGDWKIAANARSVPASAASGSL